MIVRVIEGVSGWACAMAFVLYLHAALSGNNATVNYYQGASFALAVLSITLMMRRTGMIPKQGIELEKMPAE